MSKAKARHAAPEFAPQTVGTPSAKVLFPDLKLPAGSHRIEVVLEPADALPQDDRFYAVLEHADPKALLVAPDARSDDVSYFAAAIGSLAAPSLGIEERAPEAIGSGALTGFSLLVVSDTSALSDIQAKRIKDYVATGGSVLATLGTRTAIEPGPLLEGWRISEPQQRDSRGRRDRDDASGAARRRRLAFCALLPTPRSAGRR